ncbi:MAG: hypothetical protein KDN20_16785, partial [Verrucomicrobiae bacterium]|nr:hypothetical protein [Verrucomicrobiae bacterium]
RAIERRTYSHELRTNAFTDIEAFFDYLKAHQPQVWNTVQDYPDGLKEAAFFAANRNFGWFNVIMHHAHENHQGGTIPTPELLRRFAETGKGKKSVFQIEAIGEYQIEQDSSKGQIEELMYGLLPKRIGAQISQQEATTLLEKRATGRHLFTGVVEVKSPEPHRITTQFVKSNFENEGGSVMVLPGESRFDLRVVMDSLKSYSTISLEGDQREHLLICESLAEFTAQLEGLSPYGAQANQIAPILHGMLIDSSNLVKDGDEPIRYLAPAFSFLSRFHRLNRVRIGEDGYLTESSKNTKLEEAFRDLQKDSQRWPLVLLQGIANEIERDNAPVVSERINGCKLPAIAFKSSVEDFDLAGDESIVALYGTEGSLEQIDQDLNHLAGKRPAEPVLLVLERDEQQVREEQIRERLSRTVPKMASRVVIVNLTKYLAENLARFGLLEDAFSKNDLKTSQFHAALARARDRICELVSNWHVEVLEREGLLLAPLFYGSKVGDDQLAIFARGYGAMLGGMAYQDVCQEGAVFDKQGRDEFKKLVERQVDPSARFKDEHGNAPLLSLISKPGAEEIAELPRQLLALVRHARVSTSIRSLEKQFFFQRPRKKDVAIKPSDIVRHLVGILVHLGLLEKDDDKVSRVSKNSLESRIDGASSWIDGQFEQGANQIKKIHSDEGQKLVDLKGKEARQSLKDVRKSLDSLHLDFVNKAWADLNRESGDEMPVFESQMRAALGVIAKAKRTLEQVYDPDRFSTFPYTPDTLHEFQQLQGTSEYPLWKRLKVLGGFYRELDAERNELLKQIKDIRADVDARIPDLADGPDAGRPALPTQALKMPLEMLEQELDFDSLRPNKTIAVGGSSISIRSLGYKIVDGKYAEARDRLMEIKAELNDPGKLVKNFMGCLESWENLKQRVKVVKDGLKAQEVFYADAPDDVKTRTGLKALLTKVDDLDDEVNAGGIRQRVDEADAAGAPNERLVEKLIQHLRELDDAPRVYQEKIEELEGQTVPVLTELYQQRNSDLIRAYSHICRRKGDAIPAWPEKKKNSYAATEAQFDDLVSTMRSGGESFFAQTKDTSFDDYINLLKMQEASEHIDWQSDEFRHHRDNLLELNLLELRLI